MNEEELLAQKEKLRKKHGSDSHEYRRIQAKIDYLRNPDKFKSANKKWRDAHRLEYNAAKRQYLHSNEKARQACNQRSREYYQAHKHKFILYARKRRSNPKRIDAERALSKLRVWLKSPKFPNFPKSNKPRSLSNLIGCPGRAFHSHLQSLFHSGMDWRNHGSLWHFAHKIPIRAFDCSDLSQLKACFHFSNLQPELAHQNQRRINEVAL